MKELTFGVNRRCAAPSYTLLLSPPLLPGISALFAAMVSSLLPLFVVVLSVWSAGGDPAGSTDVDGAPPSKIGKKSKFIRANVSHIQSAEG